MSAIENEPAWIRDVNAAAIKFDPALDARESGPGKGPGLHWIAELCAEETSYCEHCGAAFPMWPTKGWADHLVTAHGDALTIQARTGTSLLCSDELNEAQSQFFAMMFQSRVALRRRAWKLGFVKDPNEQSRIHIAN